MKDHGSNFMHLYMVEDLLKYSQKGCHPTSLKVSL